MLLNQPRQGFKSKLEVRDYLIFYELKLLRKKKLIDSNSTKNILEIEEKSNSQFWEARVTQMPEPGEDITREDCDRSASLINSDAEFLTRILAN